MKNKNLLLDNQLCFALYSATNSIIRYYSKHLGELGITYTQYLVLISLWDREKLTVQEIAERLKLNSSTISPVIKRLINVNLITKRRDENDERVVIVSLTNEGVAIGNKLSEIQDLVVCKSNLSEVDFLRLKKDLINLSEQFENEN